MPRRSTKKFEFAKGVYYFLIKKSYQNEIIIKRMVKTKAIQAFKFYLKTQKGKCEWLGKWNGKEFVEDNFEALKHQHLPAAIA